MTTTTTTTTTNPSSPSPTHHLTPHDALILTHILPTLSPSAPTTTLIDPTLPSPPSSLQAQESSILLALASPSPPGPVICTAIAALDNLIATHPKYASAYNNRAQATRLLVGDDLRLRAVAQSSVWADLGRAIALVQDAGASRGGAVSKAEAGVAAKALAQRAILVGRCARSPDPVGSPADGDATDAGKEADHPQVAGEESDDTNAQERPNSAYLPRELRGLSTDALEDFARRDFAAAGRYGDPAAAEMARKLDPYARLCGDVVREAMRAEMREG